MPERNAVSFQGASRCGRSFTLPWLAAILGFLVLLYVWKIGDFVFVDEDEAVYAQAAVEMLQRGDCFTTTFNFKPFLDKQPLVIWLHCAAFQVLGSTEFAARLWHSLMAVGSALVVFLLALRLFDARTGLCSTVIYGTFTVCFYQARSPMLDIPLTFFITLGLYFFLAYVESGRLLHSCLAWGLAACAVMTKGLIGIVLPAGIAAAFVVLARPFAGRVKAAMAHQLVGSLVFLALALPWHLHQIRLFGGGFADSVFVELTFQRYLYGLEGTRRYPFLTHLVTIPLAAVPWTGFLPSALVSMGKERSNGKGRVFLFVWILIVFVFFSFAAPKRVRYILPLFPALAIFVGRLWSHVLQRTGLPAGRHETVSAWLSLSIPGLVLGAVFYSMRRFPDEFARLAPFCLPPLLALCAGSLLGSLLLLLKRRRSAFGAFILTAAVSFTSLIGLAGPHFNEAKPFKAFARVIHSEARPGERIGCFPHFWPSLVFYTNRPVEDLKTLGEASAFLDSPQRVFLVCAAAQLEGLHGQARVLREQAGYLLLSNMAGGASGGERADRGEP